MTSVHDLPPDPEHLGRRRKPACPSRPVTMKVLMALAAGMAVLSVTQVVLVLVDVQDAKWTLLLGVVAVFLSVSLGLGCFAELLHRERVVERSDDGLTVSPIRDAELTGSIAHDVNNMLASILTNAQLLVMALPPEWAEEWSELRDIESAARHGADLIKKLAAQGSTPAVS